MEPLPLWARTLAAIALVALGAFAWYRIARFWGYDAVWVLVVLTLFFAALVFFWDT